MPCNSTARIRSATRRSARRVTRLVCCRTAHEQIGRKLAQNRKVLDLFLRVSVNRFVCYSLGEERARTPLSASRKTYPTPAGTADSLGHRAHRRKSSRKSREKRGFLRAVPNLSGVLTPVLRFRTDRLAPWSDSASETLLWNSLSRAMVRASDLSPRWDANGTQMGRTRVRWLLRWDANGTQMGRKRAPACGGCFVGFFGPIAAGL